MSFETMSCDELNPPSRQNAISSHSGHVRASTITRPKIFVGSDPSCPVRGCRVQLLLNQPLKRGLDRSVQLPQQQRQGIQQSLARIAPRQRIANGFQTECTEVQQAISPGRTLRALVRRIKRIVPSGKKRFLQPNALQPKPKFGAKPRQLPICKFKLVSSAGAA